MILAAAEKITLDQIRSMDLPPVIVYAIPVMLTLVLIEYLIGIYQKRNLYNARDLLASAGIGTGNVIVSAAFKLVMFAIVLFFYNLVPWRIPHTWWSYVACFVILDLCRYWAHRVAHEKRFWWATHVTHHSSGQYNFSVSFRLSWTQHIKIIFFIPVAICGFDPFVFFICHQIAVLYQFWIHTELIRKLPAPVEFLFVTPSHHRVHHGSNEKYLDKNYGSTLVIWDKIFGTFQPEEEQAIYGITKPVNSYNPVYLVFHEWIDIFRDVLQSKSFKEAWFIMFSKPGEYEQKKAREGYEEHVRISPTLASRDTVRSREEVDQTT